MGIRTSKGSAFDSAIDRAAEIWTGPVDDLTFQGPAYVIKEVR